MVYIVEQSSVLKHYGVPRRSGRYPWGSGGNVEYKDSRSFLDFIKGLFAKGLTEKEVADGLGMSTTELRAYRTIARAEKKAADVALARRLKDKGWSNVAIAERMGTSEGNVRNLLKPGADLINDQLTNAASKLMDRVDETGGFVDVGTGVDRQLGMSDTKFKTAIAMAKAQGYEVHQLQVPQVTQPGQYTQVKVLGPPGTTQKNAWEARGNIHQLISQPLDGKGRLTDFQPPMQIDPNRIQVTYGSEGGKEADGTMYIRPGVEDVSIGNNQYAQVRVAVKGDKYLKGMAIYKDDLPEGVDIVFNTNKEPTGNKLDAFKDMERLPNGEIDWDRPFGAEIKRQIIDGDERLTSSMNIVNEEGDWDNWKVALSSQVLSKQPKSLAEAQLKMHADKRQSELDEIMSLTNPEVKRKLLETFADSVDSDAVDLQAAHMLRQANQVLIPVPEMKPTEVYAPNFKQGEKVALIRHPHGGIFEIPEVTVNNNNPAAKKLLGQAKDAIGINAKVAKQLSGADFDGDAVLVIPNTSGKIKTKGPIKSIIDFEPSTEFPETPGMKYMTKDGLQMEMGKVSNLITDMTIKGANDAEIARAVRHSMVVIDSYKHKLNYKQSEIDNNIADLRERYQGTRKGAASTLISRASGPEYINERRLRPASKGGPIDPKTGNLVYEPTGRTKQGRLRKDGTRGPDVPVKTRVDRLSVYDDARKLSSGTAIESVYATHSNRLKEMARTARKEQVRVTSKPASPSAKKHYASEVESINAKLRTAQLNRPLERKAQVIANAVVEAKRQAKPGMDNKEIKKVSNQALKDARLRTDAKKTLIEFTPKEWEAVQAGAISPTKLREIMRNADLDQLKQLSTPRTPLTMTSSKLSRAKAMMANGFTQAEVADQLGVSLSTLKRGLNES